MSLERINLTKLSVLESQDLLEPRSKIATKMIKSDGIPVKESTVQVWFSKDDLPKKYVSLFCETYRLPEEIFDAQTPTDPEVLRELVDRFRAGTKQECLSIWTEGNRTLFHEGEVVQIYLTSKLDREFYLYILVIDSSSEVTLLYPSGDDNYLIRPDIKYSIPSQGGFEVNPPFGKDRLKFIMVDRPINLFEKKFKTKGLFNPNMVDGDRSRERDILAKIRVEAEVRGMSICEESITIETTY